MVVTILIGCGSQPVKQSQPEESARSINDLLILANQTLGQVRQQYLLDAAELALIDNQFPFVEQLLAQMQPDEMNEAQVSHKDLMTSAVLLQQNMADEALFVLYHITSQLPETLQLTKLRLLAQAYQLQGNYFQALIAYLDINDLIVDEKSKAQISNTIWQLLNIIPIQQLELFKDSAYDRRAEGWLQLAYISRKKIDDPAIFLSNINQWQQTFSQHQLDYVLPEAVQRAMNTKPYSPLKIALALPLSGTYANAAKTIRDGFMTALFDDSNAPELVVLDSENADFIGQMNSLNDLGVDFVVGPLTKERVFDVATLVTTNVPILTLNQIESLPLLDLDLTQFGLPVEDEAKAIAKFAVSKELKKALLLLPDNSNGARIEQAFTEAFQQEQGLIAEKVSFATAEDLETAVKSLLGIKQSNQRHKAINNLLGQELVFEPRRRQDIDFIVFSASPSMAKRVKPFLNFYYAHDLPVFANSSVYDGKNDANNNKDLSGIFFVDSPWSIGAKEEIATLKQRLFKAWPNKVIDNGHLFAFGFDAYNLIKQLPLLKTFEQYKLKGLSGDLFLDQSQHIRRIPTWARIENGLVQPVAPAQ